MSDNVAKQRILDLTDDGVFCEEYKSIEDGGCASLITGYGDIGGRRCFFYSQDPTSTEEMITQEYIEKFKNIYHMAMESRAPILGIIDGEITNESKWCKELINTAKSICGVIPQYSIIYGKSIGCMARLTTFSDFIIMRANAGEFHLLNADDQTDENKFNAQYCLDNGLVDLIGNKSMLNPSIKTLVSLFVSNNEEDVKLHQLNKAVKGLDGMQDDISTLFMNVADEYKFIELKRTYAPEIVVGLVKVNGEVHGVLGSATKRMTNLGMETFELKLSEKGSKKAKDFLTLCNNYNIPIFHYLDHKGLMDNATSVDEIYEVGKLINKIESVRGAKIQCENGVISISNIE